MNKKKNTVSPSQTHSNQTLVFSKKNYVLLAASAVVLLVGFFLMAGSEDVVDVKSTKLTVAPIVVMLGFGLAIYSILAKTSSHEASSDNQDAAQ
jgi:hypothetical protein